MPLTVEMLARAMAAGLLEYNPQLDRQELDDLFRPRGPSVEVMLDHRDLIRAVQFALSAIEASGHKIVPVEATEEIIRAVDAGLHAKWPNARSMAIDAYARMISAAPKVEG